MAKKNNKVVVLPCRHPLDQFFDQEREDGSGRVDKICGLCGIPMCEVLKPGTEVQAVEPAGESAEGEVSTLDGPDPWDDPEGLDKVEPGMAEQPPVDLVDKSAENGALVDNGAEIKSYVTRESDRIGELFTRSLPVPVPDEELAELAKKMSHTHRLWCKTKRDAKAFAKSCKEVTDKAEEDMVELSEIIESETEERPVACRWEFDYAAGIKKLRRMDNHQIAAEETLQGDELHLSFNFNGSSEAAVEQLAVKQSEGETITPETETKDGEVETGLYRPSNGTEGDCFTGQFCELCTKDDPDNDVCCDILTRTAAFGIEDPEYPQEWIYGTDGHPTCTAYEDRASEELSSEKAGILADADELF